MKVRPATIFGLPAGFLADFKKADEKQARA
jgi:hypothetical protein